MIVWLAFIQPLFAVEAPQLCLEGALRVSQIWARATSGANSAVFMRILTKSYAPKDLSIVGADFAGAETVELHDHINDNGVFRMRPIDAIPLKTGLETWLRPGGLHVMLLHLKKPLQDGEQIVISLRLSNKKSCDLKARVSLRPVP